jgi:hypothetical protein
MARHTYSPTQETLSSITNAYHLQHFRQSGGCLQLDNSGNLSNKDCLNTKWLCSGTGSEVPTTSTQPYEGAATMAGDRAELGAMAEQEHVDNWSNIAAGAWDRSGIKAQSNEVVVKPVLVNGQEITFPVTICPPGSASGLEKPTPRPIVQGGGCSPR